jgi:hypothetical protein
MQVDAEILVLPYAGEHQKTVLHLLINELMTGKWRVFSAAVAFAKTSGNYPDLLKALVDFEKAAGTERARVDHWRSVPEKLLGARYALVVGIVREVDHDPAGHVAARHLADARAPVHCTLRLAVQLKFRRLRLVHHPPEELMALEAGHDA